jgi:hypothetical protein
MQIFLGLMGVLISVWWLGMAGMVTNGAQGPEVEALVRTLQVNGLAVITAVTFLLVALLHFARHLHAKVT